MTLHLKVLIDSDMVRFLAHCENYTEARSTTDFREDRQTFGHRICYY